MNPSFPAIYNCVNSHTSGQKLYLLICGWTYRSIEKEKKMPPIDQNLTSERTEINPIHNIVNQPSKTGLMGVLLTLLLLFVQVVSVFLVHGISAY